MITFQRTDCRVFAAETTLKNSHYLALHFVDELTMESDIDLLVEFEENHIPGFLTLAGMEIELTEIIGRKVDLRSPLDLSRFFRDEVVSQAKVQYEKV